MGGLCHSVQFEPALEVLSVLCPRCNPIVWKSRAMRAFISLPAAQAVRILISFQHLTPSVTALWIIFSTKSLPFLVTIPQSEFSPRALLGTRSRNHFTIYLIIENFSMT
jgi:hypothetical protein